ncbi:hypothetical protein LLG46_03060 [bacterium]|nr:hypothetical protein [bacterium]
MIIRPGKDVGSGVVYAAGRFAENNAYVVSQAGGTSAFGGLLCCPGSNYCVEATPNGAERSYLGKTPITTTKALYIKDTENGKVWSGFYNPVCAETDEYEVRFLPGQVQAYSLKDKIACTLTIAAAPGQPCELWHVRLENRCAQIRNLRIATYVEPAVTSPLELRYLNQEKTILMRRPLESVDRARNSDDLSNLVLFHACTLPAMMCPTEKSDYIGSERTASNPVALVGETNEISDAIAVKPVAGLTIDIEIPIEGEAEFGFCFGAATNADEAAEIARSLSKTEAVAGAISSSREYWDKLTSSIKVQTQDNVLDALVNTWLPYESYTACAMQHMPNPANEMTRCLPIGANAAYLFREALVNFAARLSATGNYHPDEFSRIDLSAGEMLSLAICTASYVAETGNIGVLSQTVAFKDGLVMTLREHCERVIKKCANGFVESEQDRMTLEKAIKLWSFIRPSDEFTALLEKIAGQGNTQPEEVPEEQRLPRRVRYLQSICPTLTEIESSLPLTSETPDAENMLAVYSSLIENIFGITATYEGLIINPSLPQSWFECMVIRRFRGDTYNIHIKQSATHTGKGASIIVDGEPVLGDMLPFFADGCEHEVEVTVG